MRVIAVAGIFFLSILIMFMSPAFQTIAFYLILSSVAIALLSFVQVPPKYSFAVVVLILGVGIVAQYNAFYRHPALSFLNPLTFYP